MLFSCVRQSEVVVEPQPLPFAFSDTLLRIDSLMQHDADSALIMLTSFRPTEGSGEISYKFNDNYWSLLLSEALYKTDNPQLNRFIGVETCHGASLQDAMHYFDSLSNLGHVEIKITDATGVTLEIDYSETPAGYLYYIPTVGHYVVVITFSDGDEYYGEFEVTD